MEEVQFLIFLSLCFKQSTKALPQDPEVHISRNYEAIQQRELNIKEQSAVQSIRSFIYN